MKNTEIHQSQLNSDGSLAGIYEHDGEVGYFYLYELTRSDGQKIAGALRVSVGPFRGSSDDLSIRWSDDESAVGLFVMNQLCAAFDLNNQQTFGGDSGRRSSIPDSIKDAFRAR